MPDAAKPDAPHWIPGNATKMNLDWADLPIVDLSKCQTHEGRVQMVSRVRDALRDCGVFYVVNHGYSPAQTERMFDIADMAFSQVSEEEKERYLESIETTGLYRGYKPRRFWHMDGGTRDNVEIYNVDKQPVSEDNYPEPLRPFLPEIEAFAQQNHFHVLHPLLKVFALGLELPEDTLVDSHQFSFPGKTHVSFMKYYPRPTDEETKAKQLWLKGHTDFGTLTVIYSQPISGLQILTSEGAWKWVRHVENALVIITGDSTEYLSGGFYRATAHRVIQPPEDQRNTTRLGIFYVPRADDITKLAPFTDSPVLKRLGIDQQFESGQGHTMEAWKQGKTNLIGI